ncbi:MAG: radical SAM protein [Deltaproteobacteria bacterium]|nr:radical SAM protein [Deltaproteobacteria bacterium]
MIHLDYLTHGLQRGIHFARQTRYAYGRNRLLAELEYRTRALKMKAHPTMLTVETTTFCNLKCVMCPHALEGLVVKRHIRDSYIECLMPFLATTSVCQLHGVGEPLVSPTFWNLLERISRDLRGQPNFSINTNGLLLSKNNISRLMASKIQKINISMDAATERTYSKLRGGNFLKLKKNIGALVSAKNSYRRHDLKICINMTLMRSNIEELSDFMYFGKTLGVDEVVFWTLNEGDYFDRPWVVDKEGFRFSYSDEKPTRHPVLFNSMIQKAMSLSKQIKMPIDRKRALASLIRQDCEMLSSGRDRVTISQCKAPWSWMTVLSDGSCRSCCHMVSPIGSLNDNCVEDIWNSEIMQQVRASISKNRVPPNCRGATCRFVRGSSREAGNSAC